MARKTNPVVERGSKTLTLLGDERLIIAVEGAAWLAMALNGTRRERQVEHFGLTITVATILPHLIKRAIAQERPDRVMVGLHRHGIPKSGKACDAFPSGHAVHLAAMAAMASRFHPDAMLAAWGIAVAVASTRIVLLAQWASDVAFGIGLGCAIEKVCWRVRH